VSRSESTNTWWPIADSSESSLTEVVIRPFAALKADLRVREFFPSLQTDQESTESMQYYWHVLYRLRADGWAATHTINDAPLYQVTSE
jgi:hypothetical protein